MPGAFGALLQQHRRAARLSQEELAERAGLSRRGISDLERGVRRAPYPSTVRLLAQALGLSEAEQAALLRAGGRSTGAVPAEPRAHLPIALSSFVGRQHEVAELQRLLPSVRLLTLVGPGGIGKTRLALAIAELAEREAAFVDLAALERGAVVPDAVAAALGVVGRPGQELSAILAEVLGSRALLLVLDNCEHVVQAAAELADGLLRACPALRVLATSREPLGVPGETAWPVPPLLIPERDAELSLEQLGELGAVRLFVERTRATLPDFGLAATNAAAAAEICRHLDGIPLALELAAARVRVLGVSQLAARLKDRLGVLVGGSRTAPARQQTLRATLDWSYALLSEPERLLLARLAVFVGGWTLEAAEAVCGGDGLGVLEVLSQLADRSLVSAELHSDGSMRYRLLETVRQYAHERLLDRGEAAAVQRRHATFYAQLAEQADPELWGLDQVAWIERLNTELGNIRAALEWSATGVGDPEVGLRLAAALWWFWPRGGHVREGREHLGRLLGLNQAPTVLRAWGLHAAACAAWFAGDLAGGRAHCNEALSVATRLADHRIVAWALNGLGVHALGEGQVATAGAFLRRGISVARAVSDPVPVYTGTHFLGEVALAEGRFAKAERLLNEALGLIEAHGDHCGRSHTLFSLGHLALVRGQLARAVSLQLDSVAVRRLVGDALGVSHCLDELACIARAAGDLARAARLFGAAEAVRAPTGGGVWPPRSADRERALDATRAGLGEAAFETEWAVGAGESLEGALADARALTSKPGGAHREARPPSRRAPAHLPRSPGAAPLPD